MEVGKHYIVTKASDDGMFDVGNHIWLLDSGEIACREAMGWVEQCDVAEATKGMEVAIDQEWIERRKRKLRDELAALGE